MLTLVDRLIPSGGAERMAMEIALRLDPARFERTLCASRSGAELERSPVASQLGDAGVRIVSLGRGSRLAVWRWWPLLVLLRRERIDVLHAHMFGSNLWGTVLGRLAGVPVVIAHEHAWSFERPVQRLLDRWLIARGADALVAVSEEVRRRLIELVGIPPADIVLVRNGIPAAAVDGHADPRAELGIAPEAPVIGMVAVLRPEKGVDVLIRAAAVLVADFPSLQVLVAGDGPERSRLEALVEDLGLGGSVRLLGFRDDAPALVRSFDVAVLASDFESSSLAVMEYMDAARAVVATRVGALPELIEDGTHGLLVEPRDPIALAGAVGELLRDRPRAAAMGWRAQERRRREYDIGVTVGTVERLYEELHARARQRRRRLRSAA